MNHSIYSADRATHLKIVIVALVAGIALSGLTIAGHTISNDGPVQTVRIPDTGRPMMMTNSTQLAVR
jgi:hypothetical protein